LITGNDQKQADEITAEDPPVVEDFDMPEDGNITAGQADSKPNEALEETTAEEMLRLELESATQKAEENLELAQRTQAEMENLRKRTLRDIENAHKYALDKFVNELLPVIDSLELGIQAAESVTEIENLKEGMNLTLKKFTDSLEKFGVVIVDPLGESFNPERHEAVSMADTDEFESGVVMLVLQKGYELNGRLVRPARVVVAN
jgi:molecular chaperone GrpE